MFGIWQQIWRNKWKNIFTSFQIEAWGTLWNGFVLQNVFYVYGRLCLDQSFIPWIETWGWCLTWKYQCYRTIFFFPMIIWKFSYAHMEYQCCMFNSIINTIWENNNPIRHYDTNNAILAMTFPLNKKNWFVAWAIFQSLVHFFHFLKHLSLMLFFARIDLFN